MGSASAPDGERAGRRRRGLYKILGAGWGDLALTPAALPATPWRRPARAGRLWVA